MDEVIQFTSSIFNLKKYGAHHEPRTFYAALFSSGLELLSGG